MAFSPKSAARKAQLFIRECFSSSGRKTAVVGLSGGLDSAVALCLCVRALGRRRVIAVLMPSPHTPKKDLADAKSLAKKLGVKALFFPIGRMLSSFGPLAAERLSRANLSARIRMAILYSIAQKEEGLVVGTGDKSEFLLGYFTKYGDGGADLFPIGCFYKTEVKRMGELLGVPRPMLDKPPSPALWSGHTAEGELGFSYNVADRVLSALENKEKPEKIGKKFGRATVRAILQRMKANRHKLSPAPVCPI